MGNFLRQSDCTRIQKKQEPFKQCKSPKIVTWGIISTLRGWHILWWKRLFFSHHHIKIDKLNYNSLPPNLEYSNIRWPEKKLLHLYIFLKIFFYFCPYTIFLHWFYFILKMFCIFTFIPLLIFMQHYVFFLYIIIRFFYHLPF
jgi:hypothetical protein